jgi:hypothetical protein
VDLLELAAQEEREERLKAGPPPCLFDTPARGFAARTAEYAGYEGDYGHAAAWNSHGWRNDGCHPGKPTGECQPTVLKATLPGHPEEGRPCGCAGGTKHRGACLGCDWEGPARDHENEASEDACDHAWPAWRDMPVVPSPPHGKALAAWTRKVAAQYPDGWVAAGGPIRTRRPGIGSRHHSMDGPLGYDMCAEAGA